MTPWLPINTERLLLRELLSSDEEDLWVYESDDQVVLFDDWGPNSIETTRSILNQLLEEQQAWPRDSVTAAIELRATGKLIGTIHFTTRDRENRTADCGYVLSRTAWGQGYATEAARAFLDACFRAVNLHRIWATCDTRNHASYRVMEKLGMRREATFRKDVLQRGEWRDSYLYAILEEEWLSR